MYTNLENTYGDLSLRILYTRGGFLVLILKSSQSKGELMETETKIEQTGRS